MKGNTIKEMKEILDAIEQGKMIQWYDSATNTWRDLDINQDNPNFNFIHRIKPEAPKKRWRPFKNVQEFIDAAGGLGSIWIRGKNDQFASQVTCIDYADYSVDKIWIDSRWLSFNVLFEEYIFADGRQCGVEE